MTGSSAIREHIEVIGADGVHIGTIDRLQGARIKLRKEDSGQSSFVTMARDLRKPGGGGQRWLSEADTEPCSEMPLSTSTTNLPTLPVGGGRGNEIRDFTNKIARGGASPSTTTSSLWSETAGSTDLDRRPEGADQLHEADEPCCRPGQRAYNQDQPGGSAVRQAGRIFVSHSMQVIDCSETLPAPLAGGLAPWQETRAKALMTTHLGHDITLALLASECKLSVSHFARSFKQSTGKPPHRWLLESRVEKAKELLMGTDLPLAQTALACGFADQSHFTRVFSRTVGISPGTWRRLRLNQQITERVIFGNEMADAGADTTEMTQIPEFPSYRNSAL